MMNDSDVLPLLRKPVVLGQIVRGRFSGALTAPSLCAQEPRSLGAISGIDIGWKQCRSGEGAVRNRRTIQGVFTTFTLRTSSKRAASPSLTTYSVSSSHTCLFTTTTEPGYAVADVDGTACTHLFCEPGRRNEL